MVDNVSITAGSGTTIAADDIGGVLYQRVKVAFGVDGSATDASASNPLPITALSLPLPAGAATSAKQAALGTAGTSSTDVLTVQGIASMTPLLSSITTLPALVAGSALIGKVGLDQTTPGTTNAVSLAQIGANTVATGNGVVGTGVQRVAIASDNTAFSVNAIQSGTYNVTTVTSLLQFGGNAINLGAGAVGTGTLRITQASDSPLVTGLGSTTDAAAANGAAGSALAYLRSIKDAATDTTTPSPIKIDQTTPGTTNAVVATQIVGANSTTGDTGAKTATGNGATQTNSGNRGVQILFAIGTVSGTSPTFVGKVQGSVDGGTTWYDVPGAATASLTATGNYGITIYPGIAVTAGTTTTGTTAAASSVLPSKWRVVWTIGGTTPSFTITNVQYNYLVN